LEYFPLEKYRNQFFLGKTENHTAFVYLKELPSLVLYVGVIFGMGQARKTPIFFEKTFLKIFGQNGNRIEL